MSTPQIPENDELERQAEIPDAIDTLQRVGSMQVLTDATLFGEAAVQASISVTDMYKKETRAMATMGEDPEDTNGLGYNFTKTTIPEV
jgi:hypothetical protein